ncbi:hypothetical protein BDC45DRAFT_523793 [Circinella umbellata]|nr:hypothetical protein BDC45DRAFT_523793 [Circinella umbellata]
MHFTVNKRLHVYRRIIVIRWPQINIKCISIFFLIRLLPVIRFSVFVWNENYMHLPQRPPITSTLLLVNIFIVRKFRSSD